MLLEEQSACPATPHQSKESNPSVSYPSLLIQTGLYDLVMIKKATRFHQLSLLHRIPVSGFALGQFPNTSAYGCFSLVKVRNRNTAQAIYRWTIQITVFLVSCCVAGRCLAIEIYHTWFQLHSLSFYPGNWLIFPKWHTSQIRVISYVSRKSVKIYSSITPAH